MTRARLSRGYKPDFDIDMRYGEDGERVVSAFLHGLLDGTVEVKSDARAIETQRVYIEGECKRRDGWQPSGIRSTFADYWALVIGESVVIGIPSDVLRRIYDKAHDPSLRLQREEKDGSHPTRGVAIPLGLLIQWILNELRRDRMAA